jgi:hypothetical protein
MLETHRPRSNTFPWVAGWLAAVAVAMIGGGCEENAMGRSCNLSVHVDPAQGAYTMSASDCPTRMCVKPAVQQGAPQDLDTGAYCSKTCLVDSDCQGQTRDLTNKNDKRCKRGYTCDIAFGPSDSVAGGGQLCCQKICLCKDFYPPSQEPTIPEACQSGSDASCSGAQRD